MCIKDSLGSILSLNFIEINDLIKELEITLNINSDLMLTSEKDGIENKEKSGTNEKPIRIEIILKSIKPDKKISVLKTIKTLLNIGLKESKDIIENLPQKLKETSIIKESEDIKEQVESAGGIVELKSL